MSLVKIQDCSLGVNTDLSPDELPNGVWSDVRNVRFKGGFASSMRGIAQIFSSPAISTYWLAPYAAGSSVFWVHAGLAAVYVDDGTTRTDITGTAPTGGIDDRWTGGSLNGVFVCNNGVDQPMYWGGNVANNLATLTGWDANWRAAVIRPWRNFLVALDVTKSGTRYPHMLKLSDAAVPGAVPSSWDATSATTMALERDLAETSDYMVDALPLGDALIVYKQRSMYIVRQTFDDNIISSQRLPGDHGLLARGCVANCPQGHVVLTTGDVVLHAGQGAQSIADDVVRGAIFAGIDSTNYRRAFVVANPKRSEVWVCYPTGGQSSCTRAAVWNWDTQKWTFRDLPNITFGAFGQIPSAINIDSIDGDSGTIDSDPSPIDENSTTPNEARLVVCSTSAIGVTEAGSTDLGASVTAYLERRGLHFDAPESMKRIRRVLPRFKGGPGNSITVTIGTASTPNGTYTTQATQTFTIGTDYKVDLQATGRYFSIKFSGTGHEWAIRGFDVDLDLSGAR